MDASDGYDLVALLQPFSEGLGLFLFFDLWSDHEEVHDQKHPADEEEKTQSTLAWSWALEGQSCE